MAIDPNISLQVGQGVPQFDPLAAAERGFKFGELMMQPEILVQKLAQARAQEALTREQISSQQEAQAASRAAAAASRAETAKVEQATDENQRLFNSDKWLAQNVGKYYDAKTGKLNREALMQDYYAAGHAPERLFTFRSQADKEQSERLKSKADFINYAEDRVLKIANVIDKIPDKSGPAGRRQAADILKAEAESLAGVVGPEVAQQVLFQRFGVSGTPGADQPQMVQTPNGPAMAPPVAPSLFERARAALEGTVSEKDRQELRLKAQEIGIAGGHLQVARDTLELAKRREGATAEDKDRNSKTSVALRAAFEAINAPKHLYDGLDADTIRRNPVAMKVLESYIPTAEIREKNKQEAVQAESSRKIYDEGIASGSRLVQLPTMLGSMAGEVWRNAISLNPDAKKLQAAIDDYNKRNGTNYSVPKHGVPGVLGILSTEQDRLNTIIERVKSGVTSPTLAESGAKVPTTETTPAAPGAPVPSVKPAKAPEQMVTVIRLSDKAKFQIPKSQLQGVLSSGQYERAKE